MTRTEARVGDWLKVGGYLALFIVALPAVAVIVFIGRGVLLVLAPISLVALLVAYSLSPAFRAWFDGWAEDLVTFSGLRLAPRVSYHPSHTWVRIEGSEVTVGADDLLQAALGPVRELVLPAVGHHVAQGDPLVRVVGESRSVEAKAPVSGTVLSVNRQLDSEPRRVNDDPFGQGWLVTMSADQLRRERKVLVRGEGARSWFRGEVDHLFTCLGSQGAVPTLPDGGILVDRLHRHIDGESWDRLAEELFGG